MIWVLDRSMMEPFNWNCLFKTRGGLEAIDAFLTAPMTSVLSRAHVLPRDATRINSAGILNLMKDNEASCKPIPVQYQSRFVSCLQMGTQKHMTERTKSVWIGGLMQSEPFGHSIPLSLQSMLLSYKFSLSCSVPFLWGSTVREPHENKDRVFDVYPLVV